MPADVVNWSERQRHDVNALLNLQGDPQDDWLAPHRGDKKGFKSPLVNWLIGFFGYHCGLNHHQKMKTFCWTFDRFGLSEDRMYLFIILWIRDIFIRLESIYGRGSSFKLRAIVWTAQNWCLSNYEEEDTHRERGFFLAWNYEDIPVVNWPYSWEDLALKWP